MILTNTRHQHAVGQGGFHTASLHDEDVLRLRYVYDCGAMQKYAGERDARIAAYVSAVGAGQKLDLLFISHVHADHLNGVEMLLGPTGLKVDTIILPFLNVIDRTIAFAQTAAEDPASATSDFYQAFTINPTQALARFQPRQIIYVQAGGRDDGGAPGSRGEPPESGPAGELHGGKRDKHGLAWTLVGRGQVNNADPVASELSSAQGQTTAALITDTMAMMTQTRGGSWLLSPFIDPTIASDRKKFMVSLAKRLKISRKALDAWVKITANLETLLTTKRPELVGAYSDVAKDLNLTSMSLYSGPAPSSVAAPRSASARLGRVTYDRSNDEGLRIGWLATGDAALADKKRRDALTGHYGRLLEDVMTLVLPHHGSDHNFDPGLLHAVQPVLCLAAADRFSNWKHPGPHAIQSVASQGLFLQVVTSNTPSEVVERAAVG